MRLLQSLILGAVALTTAGKELTSEELGKAFNDAEQTVKIRQASYQGAYDQGKILNSSNAFLKHQLNTRGRVSPPSRWNAALFSAAVDSLLAE